MVPAQRLWLRQEAESAAASAASAAVHAAAAAAALAQAADGAWRHRLLAAVAALRGVPALAGSAADAGAWLRSSFAEHARSSRTAGTGGDNGGDGGGSGGGDDDNTSIGAPVAATITVAQLRAWLESKGVEVAWPLPDVLLRYMRAFHSFGIVVRASGSATDQRATDLTIEPSCRITRAADARLVSWWLSRRRRGSGRHGQRPLPSGARHDYPLMDRI